MTHQGGQYSLQQLLDYARQKHYPTERAKLEHYIALKATLRHPVTLVGHPHA